MRTRFARQLVALMLCLLPGVGLAQQESPWDARLAEAFRHLDANRIQEASAIFDEVAVAARAAGDDRSLGEARRGQGRVLAAMKDATGALAAYEDALRLFEKAGDMRGVGHTRSAIAYAAWLRADWAVVRSQYELAADAFGQAGLPSDQAGALRNMTFSNMPPGERVAILERALALAREGPDRHIEGLILHGSGDMLFSSGDYQGALERYETALPLLEVGKGDALPRLLTSIGRLHRVHGNPEEAVPYYERALDLQSAKRDLLGMSQTEDALAIAKNHLGRLQEALAHAERGLSYAVEGGATPVILKTRRLTVGEIALRAGQVDRGLELLHEEQTVRPQVVRRLVGRSEAFRLRGQLEQALVEADAAVGVARELTWEDTAVAFSARAQVHEQSGRLAAAIDDAVHVVRVLDEVRTGLVLSDNFRAAFSDGYRRFFDRAVELLSRAGRAQEAYEISERGRARALLDLRTARAAGRSAPGEPARLETPPGQVGAAGEALVAYWVTREATHAWVVNAGRVLRSERFAIGRDEIARLVAGATAFQPGPAAPTLARRGKAQTTFASDPRPTLRRLHDRIFGPLRTALPQTRGARLLVIPDGPLLGLSFAELIGRTGRYVVEDYTLQYAPSVALLGPTDRPAPASPDTSALLVSLSSGYPKASGETLAPLPGTRREVEALARHFPPHAATFLSEADATEARLREVIGDPGVVHLATHAVVSSRAPAESFLALRAGGGHDGRLTAGEIIGLSLQAELVVLSACRGASGHVAGEGMLGLSRAFLAAGAHALLASVRDLPDEAAAEILPRFYASWRKTGDAAAALRAAQLEQLRRLRSGRVKVDTPFGPVTLPEHPALWAGFVLIGRR